MAAGPNDLIRGHLVKNEGAYLYNIDGSFLADCGTERRAIKVQRMLYNGKIGLNMVKEIFGNTGGKKSRVDDDKVSGEM